MMLENEKLHVEFDPRHGGICSLRDKTTGREYIAPGRASTLFRVIRPEGERLAHPLDCAAPVFEVAGNELRISCQMDGVEAHATLRLEGSALEGTLTLHNTGSLAIEETHFPRVYGVAPLDNGLVTLPHFGKRQFDPMGPQFSGDRRHAEQYMAKIAARYPERMATAWMDYSSAESGIGIETRHTDFSIVDFFVAKTLDKKVEPIARWMDFTTAFPHRVLPGERWTSPLTRIEIHPGDWHATADAHREWLETWIQRADRPRKVAETVGWHYFFLKHQDATAKLTYADIPRMAEAALAAGVPYVLLFGWHEGGHDNHYFYRYVPNRAWGGEEALREAIAKAQALGAEVIPFFNGTLANVNMPEHKEFGHRWEARTREDAPYHAGDWAGFTTDVPSPNRARMHHEICPCAEHQAYFLDTVKRLVAQYGYGNIQLDQISIKMMLCYQEAHAHTRPDRACVDGFARLLRETRAFVQDVHPGGMLLSEGTNEFTAQWCDAAWTWDFLEKTEPILYGLPWLLTSTAIDAPDYGDANRAFVHKILFDLRIAGGDELITEYPAFTRHVAALAALKRRCAPYYADAAFRDREGIAECNVVKGEVVAKSYRDAKTRRGAIVVAETAGAAAEIQLATSWQPETGAVTVESSSGKTAQVTDTPLALNLAPYETVIVCIDGIVA